MTKEPEMLQPGAFCEHTMQQNATAASAPPDPLAGFKGAASRRGGSGEGREREGRGWEEKGGEG